MIFFSSISPYLLVLSRTIKQYQKKEEVFLFIFLLFISLYLVVFFSSSVIPYSLIEEEREEGLVRREGIFLSVEEDSSSSFSFSLPLLPLFDSNDVSRGRDVYIECIKLEGGVPSSFSFMMKSIEEEEEGEFSFNGRDSSLLPSVFDFFAFMMKYEEDDVYIDGREEEGKDEEYCGVVLLPCRRVKE
jgi:hypothetical protein